MKHLLAITMLCTLFAFTVLASETERIDGINTTAPEFVDLFDYQHLPEGDTSGNLDEILNNSFKVEESSVQNEIGRIEYFINSDPGFGNGISLDFTLDNSDAYVSENIDVSQFDEGFNFFYVRSQTVSGAWGMTVKRAFFLKSDSKPGIKSLEYYFTGEGGFSSSVYNYQLENSEESFVFGPDVSELSFANDYTMHVWAIDSMDRRSFEASMDFTYQDNQVGINDIVINRNFIYPNPATEVINLKLDNQLIENSTQFRILSIDGKIYKQANMNTLTDPSFNIAHLPKGKYFIQLMGERIYMSSFIKQ
ncbi:T9SS type A sorting domain-containing protein [Maribellus mangrovi]|uniref:T9SS type A sorting domain-containing protein n=1 Tax=Maribellus mangrovi TaxID=3133146 RepID=UPI0030EB5A45